MGNVIRWLRTVFRRGRVERELASELRFHVEACAEDLVRAGATREEALRQAALEFGSIEQAKEECRDELGVTFLETLRQDLRYAWRSFRRNPGFTVVVVAALGIGIGANTAIFTLINAVVVRDLPVPHPEELVAIGNPAMVTSSGCCAPRAAALSYPLYKDIRDQGGPFSGILAAGHVARLDVLVDGSRELEHPRGRFVSDNYFSVLGVPPWRGRVFDGSEDRVPGGSPVATISHAYWQRRFQQDPSVIGRTIVVNQTPITIIGVTGPSFSGEVVGDSPDLWLPISMHDVLVPHSRILEERRVSWLLALGRLAPGATLEQAHQELTPFITRTLVAHATAEQATAFMARRSEIQIGPGRRGLSEVRATFETPLFTLMIGVALLLCIICANVANLQLARAIARGREMAVRLALGAGRRRLVRQLLTESLALALLGAGLGLFLAWLGSHALLALAADGSAIPLDLSLDLRVLGFTLLVSFLTVGLFGLAPALKASRVDQATTLRGTPRTVAGGALGTRGRRAPLGRLLISGQVALSVVLLVGAAMLVRSLRNVQGVDVGLDRDHLLIVDLDISARGHPRERWADLIRTLRDRLAATPGVRAVSYSENGIFSGTEWHSTIRVPGMVMRTENDGEIATDNVGPGYIAAAGGRLLEGRDFTDGDAASSHRVAIVNQAFAKFYFPGESGLGKYFLAQDTLAIEIVGVAADIRGNDLTEVPDRRAYAPYMPMDTVGTNPTDLRFIIRAEGDPAGLVEPVRRVVGSVDPMLPINSIDPLKTLLRQSIREQRLVANLAAAFGVLAMLLAGIGLYGVMTYAISRRTAEIGLRTALGAQGRAILRLVLSDALRLVGAGMIVGVPLAVASTRFLGSQIHDVPAVDPRSIGLALLLLAAGAVIAALLPALRATRVSPLMALQSE